MSAAINRAAAEAITKLAGLSPYWFRGEPLAYDAEMRAKDVEDIITNIVMPLLSEIAGQVQSEFGIEANLTDGLHDQMHDLLGSLSKRAEELREEEHYRASRSYQRGAMSGVL